MKKGISILLTVVLLFSLNASGWAEEGGITAAKVYQWLEEGDEASETVEDQAANGALRLAEMMVVLNSLYIETEEDADHLNSILDNLSEVDIPDENYQNKLAMGLAKVFEGLLIFEQQIDTEGKYEDELYKLFESFSAGDEKMQNSKEQAVNALYHSVYLTALILQELCPDQQMLGQLQEELRAFSEGDEAASNASEQLVNGGETLFRLLTAIAFVSAPDDSFTEDISEISENKYSDAETESDETFLLASWLYGCVAMTGVLTEEAQA